MGVESQRGPRGRHFVSEKFFTFVENFPKILDFHPPKFLMTSFLVIDQNFEFSPYFPVSLIS